MFGITRLTVITLFPCKQLIMRLKSILIYYICKQLFKTTSRCDNNDELKIKIDNLDAKIAEILKKLNTDETRKNS